MLGLQEMQNWIFPPCCPKVLCWGVVGGGWQMSLGRGRRARSGPIQLVRVCGQAGQPCSGADQDGNGSLGAEPEGLAAMPGSN